MKVIFSLFVLAILGVNPAYAQERLNFQIESDQGTFLIDISWIPDDLGKNNVFEISFVEPETGIMLEDIKYDFAIVDSESGQQVFGRVDQVSTEQMVQFDSAGPYTLMVQDIEGLGENAKLEVQVTPEFQPGTVIGMLSALVVSMILVHRCGKNLITS